MTQYVRVQFRPGSPSYTYSWDGEALQTGDYVRVPSKNGGLTLARVIEISEEAPKFATKAISSRA